MKQWFKINSSLFSTLISCIFYKVFDMEGTINILIGITIVVITLNTINSFIQHFSKKRQEADNNRKLVEYLRVKSDALGAEMYSNSFISFSQDRPMRSPDVCRTYKSLLAIAYNFYKIAFSNEKTQARLAFFTVAANAEKDPRMDKTEHEEMKTYIDKNFYIPKQ